MTERMRAWRERWAREQNSFFPIPETLLDLALTEFDEITKPLDPHTDGRSFHCFFNFLGWHHWSLGLHFDPTGPHVEFHVPFGYARIGWLLNRVGYVPRAFGWRN